MKWPFTRKSVEAMPTNEREMTQWLSTPPPFELNELEKALNRADRISAENYALERDAAIPRTIANAIARDAYFDEQRQEFRISLHAIELGWSEEERRAWKLARALPARPPETKENRAIMEGGDRG